MINNFVVQLASSLIRCIEFLLFARALMSWFPQGRGSKIYDFLFTVTEPIILPFRKLLEKFDALRGIPFDIAFLLAWFALELIRTLLYLL